MSQQWQSQASLHENPEGVGSNPSGGMIQEQGGRTS